MKVLTRKKTGALIALLALLCTLALGLAGVGLITMRERYLEETGKRSISLKVRWPLALGVVVFVGGVVMMVLPRSKSTHES